MKLNFLFTDGVKIVQELGNEFKVEGMDFLAYIHSAKKANSPIQAEDNDGNTYTKTFDELESITITFD